MKKHVLIRNWQNSSVDKALEGMRKFTLGAKRRVFSEQRSSSLVESRSSTKSPTAGVSSLSRQHSTSSASSGVLEDGRCSREMSRQCSVQERDTAVGHGEAHCGSDGCLASGHRRLEESDSFPLSRERRLNRLVPLQRFRYNISKFDFNTACLDVARYTQNLKVN